MSSERINYSITRSHLLRATLLCAAVAATVGTASALSPRADGGSDDSSIVSGPIADVSIVDRTTGQVLPIYRYRGELWVAGRTGGNYAVRFRNLQDRRIMGVISVDGVNAVTGKTASSRANDGYVLDAGDSYDVTGWRKSNSSVAAFYFSESDMSYASRTGRPGDVGVIGVALYREKLPEPPAYQPDYGRVYEESSSAVAADAAAPNAAAKEKSRSSAPRATPSLGTGHGKVERSEVNTVDFEADTSRPRQIVRIRYDSYDNLVAKRVIPVPTVPRRPAPRTPSAFPGDNGYVPDPPRN